MVQLQDPSAGIVGSQQEQEMVELAQAPCFGRPLFEWLSFTQADWGSDFVRNALRHADLFVDFSASVGRPNSEQPRVLVPKKHHAGGSHLLAWVFGPGIGHDPHGGIFIVGGPPEFEDTQALYDTPHCIDGESLQTTQGSR